MLNKNSANPPQQDFGGYEQNQQLQMNLLTDQCNEGMPLDQQ